MRSSPDNKADVVVVGAGIVGSASAYYLAKRGLKVVLCDKGKAGDAQSGRSMGAVRQQAREAVEIPLMMEGVRIWKELEAELETDVEWIQGGNLGLATRPEEMERFERARALGAQFGVNSRVLTPREIKALIPLMGGEWLGGLYNDTDGHADPPKASRAFTKAAERLGVRVLEHCAVERFLGSNGSVQGVQTEQGPIEARMVILAAGAHSAKLGRMVGVDLPVRVVRTTVAATEVLPAITPIHVWAKGFVVRQTRSGSVHLNFHSSKAGEYDITLDSFRHLGLFLPVYLKNRTLLRVHLGLPLLQDILRRLPGSPARAHPFHHEREREPKVNLETVERCRRAFIEQFPSFGDVKIERTWAGMIDATPDLLPVLGPVPEVKGLLLATGFSGHGFALGPVIGRIMAEWVVDGKPSFDLHAMRYTRFAEGDVRMPQNLI
jgi:glycine/D-amino acid oxidase-like deaminating enzyme